MARVYPRACCVWLAACASAALAAQPGPTPEQLKEGERVFRDVYGKEYDRVTKGKATPADRAALGKKLWESARSAADDPGLGRVLADKALPLALGDPSGYQVALEIRQSRVTDGKDRADQLAAVAGVLEKMARVEATEKRAALAEQAVELYREAAELEADAGQAAEAAGYVARAKAVAGAYLPPAQALAVARDIATAQAETEALRKHAAEVAKLREAVKAKPDDPKANQALALALLRGGREGEAVKHLAAAPAGKLPALADLLATNPPDHARAGDLYRGLAEDDKELRAAFQGLARRHYEAALAADPKHPDGTRLRLLVKDLPAFRAPGPRMPTDATALVDENPAITDAFARGRDGTGKVEWSYRDGLAGGGCLKVTPARSGVLDGRTFADEAVFKYTLDGAAEYRYVGFAYRQVGGTRTVIQFYTAAGPVGMPMIAGPSAGLGKCYPIGEKPAEEWTVVTRDLFADNRNNPAAVCGIGIATDGELYLDAVYLAKNQHLRDLRRVYTVLGAGAKPKP